MDEIARLAGISKKTIYEEFSSKEELVNAAIEAFISEYKCDLDEMGTIDDSAIDHLFGMTRYLRETFSSMNPLLMQDIQRFYPKCWQKINEFKTEKVLRNIVMVLDQGKQSGDFRKEINSELLAHMRMDQITNTFSSNYSKSSKSFLDCQLAILDHFIHGILTDQGRSKYYRKLQTQEF
ncbi:TetR family transcriptional regulator [Cyclobacterium qasimii]|nr:TetR family transcriptional regulator [Cyclobacterium qasimii]